MSDEIQEALAIALNYLIEGGKLVNPPESYLSAIKTCGGQTCLTPVHRWSTSQDAPWAEVISAPRAMSGGQGAHAVCTEFRSSVRTMHQCGRRATDYGPTRPVLYTTCKVSRGWARPWPTLANLPLTAVFRPLSAAIRRVQCLRNRHLRVGTPHPRLVLRRSLAAKELP